MRLKLLTMPYNRPLSVKLDGDKDWRTVYFTGGGYATVTDERLARHLVRNGYCINLDAVSAPAKAAVSR